jgi:sulfonate transport system permease protein
LAYAWIACVGSELFMSSAAGMGSLLAAGRTALRMDYVLLGIVIIGATGYAMTRAISAIEKHVLVWRPGFND